MVATRRSKRGNPLEIDSQESQKSHATKTDEASDGNSSDSDLEEDLETLVSRTFEKIRSEPTQSKLKNRHENPENRTSGESNNFGFVIDKLPGKKPSEHEKFHIENQHVDSENVKSDEETDSDSESDNEVSATSSKRPKVKSLELASSLQTTFQTPGLYVNVDAYRNPTAERRGHKQLLEEHDKEIMKKSVLKSDLEKQHNILPYEESLNQLKKQRQKERESTKGKNWSHMPATELTEERKNDLMVLKMRRVLDPKRFYKGNDIKGLPKYFEFGKVVDSPLDFYHSRIPKKQRKNNMVEELMADAQFRNYNKRKYTEIQEATRKSKGAFKHMKRLKKKKR